MRGITMLQTSAGQPSRDGTVLYLYNMVTATEQLEGDLCYRGYGLLI